VNKSIKKWVKAIVSILLLLPILIFNDITGFTFYYFNGRKVEQVARITEVLGDSSLTPAVKQWLYHTREEIISRKSLSSELVPFLFATTEIKHDTNSKHIETGTTNKYFIDTCITHDIIRIDTSIIHEIAHTDTNIRLPNTAPAGINSNSPHKGFPAETISDSISTDITATRIAQAHSSKRNNWWFFFWSSWLFLIVIAFCTPFIVFSNNDIDGIGLKIFIIFSVWGLGLLVSLLYYWLFGLIFTAPILGHWWITYLIVAIISPLTISIAGALYSGAFKKSKNK
jgi:hypothetical protein